MAGQAIGGWPGPAPAILAIVLLAALGCIACLIALYADQKRRLAASKKELKRISASLDCMLYEAKSISECVSIIIHILLQNRAGTAFREALTLIAKTFGVPTACFALTRNDGKGMLYDQEGKSSTIDPEEWKKLTGTLADPVWRAGDKRLALPLVDREESFALAAHLGSRGIELGYLILARPSSAFAHGESVRLSSIAESLSPVLVSRFGLFSEQTKRLAAEQELAESLRQIGTFVDNSPDMVYRSDAGDRLVSINPAGLAMIGVGEASECLGRPFSDFVLNKQDRSILLHQIRTEGKVRDFEIVLSRRGGDELFCIESSQAYYGKDGEYEGVQGIIKDISARMENEKKMWKLAMELSEANRALEGTRDLVIMQEKLASIGQLAAGVAHEINNPLGFLKSNNEMQKSYVGALVGAWRELSAKLPEEGKAIAARHDLDFAIDSLKTMNEESRDGIERIVRIVSNLKSFARKDSGGAKAPYDINAGIESTLVMATNELKYVAEVEKNLGQVPTVVADGNEINQVILNILVNAGQAIAGQARKGKGHITIRTGRRGDGVECVIADDGPGMEPEVKARIFDPFFTTKEAGKGTGLGLSISNDIIVGKHGGTLGVESAPGEGATFSIYLPAQPPRPAP